MNGDDDDSTSQGNAQGGPLGLIGYRTACGSSGKRGSPAREDAKKKKLQTQKVAADGTQRGSDSAKQFNTTEE